MANKPLRMQKIKQILLLIDRGYSQRSIEKQTGVNRRTIAVYLQRLKESGFTVSELLNFDEEKLHVILSPSRVISEEREPRHEVLESLIPYFKTELNRVGVTRNLLWQEYIVQHPDGFGYSRFCELLQTHFKKHNATMHFEHVPGHLMQVDFAGDKLHYFDPNTGEQIDVPVFVVVLPYSGYSYVEALANASVPQVIRALNNSISYFGGCPEIAKSDNMKQWVVRSCRYEPKFNDLIEQWGNHNQIVLKVARVRKPRDKATVEGAVLNAYRRIYAPLRNERFTCLEDLNKAIRLQLTKHHEQNFQGRTYSRKDRFENEEKPLLQALVQKSFVIKHYTKAKIQSNYHIMVGEDKHYYSVPFKYIGSSVNVVYCTDHIEIYLQNTRIALHRRNYRPYTYTTLPDHQPPHHRRIGEQNLWDPDMYLHQAEQYGPCTRAFFKKVMEDKTILDQSFQSCQGLLRIARQYPERIEGACQRALRGCRFNYTTIKNIITNKMDLLEEKPSEGHSHKIGSHSNIRGSQEYN